jgi:hypothetical protein
MTTTTEEFLRVLDAGQEQDDASIVVAVTDDDPNDERTAQDAIEEGWGDDVSRFFAAGWKAEWTGSSDTWGDGTNTSDVCLTPPDAE